MHVFRAMDILRVVNGMYVDLEKSGFSVNVGMMWIVVGRRLDKQMFRQAGG